MPYDEVANQLSERQLAQSTVERLIVTQVVVRHAVLPLGLVSVPSFRSDYSRSIKYCSFAAGKPDLLSEVAGSSKLYL